MWDSFLIFAAKHPFIITLTPLIFALLINSFLKSKIIKNLLLCGGLFASLFFGIFLHIRWDSFSIHFLDQNLAHIRDKSVLLIGDSITCEGRRPRGFITKFEAVLPLKTEVICAKGAQTNIIAKNVKTSRINYQPDIIIFQSGINDLINGHHREKIRKEQLKLETEIQEKFPKSVAYFLPIHPLNLNQELTKDSPSIHSVLANIWNGFEKSFLEKDGIHLNAKGHTFLSQKLLTELSKII